MPHCIDDRAGMKLTDIAMYVARVLGVIVNGGIHFLAKQFFGGNFVVFRYQFEFKSK